MLDPSRAGEAVLTARAASGRRRVLLINNSLAAGGLERQLLLLAGNLPDRWDVRLWTMEAGPFAERCREEGIPWRSRPRRWRYDVSPAVDLWRVIRDWRPRLVHAWHSIPAAAALAPCRLTRTPLIDGSIRMGFVPDGLHPRRDIMRLSTLVVANSQAGLDAWRIPPSKGRVIYNAFDMSRLAIPAAPSAGATRRFVVVMAARMDRQKDFDTVLATARLLEQRSPGAFSWTLVGDGEERARLEGVAGPLERAGVVEMRRGGIEAIAAVAAADAGVLLTDASNWAEGCSNSLMEYMACGRPVVCTDSGGNRELVRDGTDGFVIGPFDAEALADRLIRLKDDRELAASMAEAGRRRISECFTVDRMVALYEEAYEEAMARVRRRSV